MTKLPIEKAYAQLEHLHNECEGRYKELQTQLETERKLRELAESQRDALSAELRKYVEGND